MKNKICLRLKLEKKLNIGTGNVTTKIAADNPIYKVDNQIVLPASTIKGLLRTSLIRVASLLGYDEVTVSINPEKMEKEDIVTALFGKPDGQGKIFVNNAYLNSETFVLTHVRIDDKTGTAEKGRLYSTEYIPPNLEFEINIDLFDINLDELRALMTAIAELNYERIGKSGVISVKIDKNKSKIDKKFLEDEIVRLIWEVLSV